MRSCFTRPVFWVGFWLAMAAGVVPGSWTRGSSGPSVLESNPLQVVTTAAERHMGRDFIRMARSHLRFVEDPLLLKDLERIGARLTSTLGGEPRTIRFHLVENPKLNAFAGPGGQIVLFTGLIATAETEAELASVLAHELAHVTQRHLSRMIERARDRQIPATVGMIAAILLGGQTGAATMAVTNAAAISDQLSYNRAFEREADAIALRILSAAGYDLNAMARFIRRLAQDTRFQSATMPEYFRTHPLSLDRIAEIEGRAITYPVVADIGSAGYLYFRARTIARHSSDAEYSAAAFRDTSASDNPEVANAGQYGLVLAGLRTGTFKQSVELASSLYQQDSQNLYYVVGLTEALQAAGDIDRALKVLASAVAVNPDDGVLATYYADVLIKAGQADQAKPVIRAGLRVLPESIVLFKLMARAEGELGHPAASFQAMAEYHYLSGDLDAALAKLKSAMQHAGDSAYLNASITTRQTQIQQEIDQMDD